MPEVYKIILRELMSCRRFSRIHAEGASRALANMKENRDHKNNSNPTIAVRETGVSRHHVGAIEGLGSPEYPRT